MATKIKAIKCPQCGSTQQTETRPNYFRCNSCGTEYFIDNENDITITHKYDIPVEQKYGIPNNPPQFKKVIATIAIACGIILLLSFLPSLLFSHKNKNNTAYNQTKSSKRSKEKTLKWDYAKNFGFETVNKQSIFVVVGTRQSNDRSSESRNLFAGFYDAVSGKEIKIQELNITLGTRNHFEFAFRRFENGDCYCIINEKKLLKIDRQYINIEEVSPDTYKDIEELNAGIAKIQFAYSGDGDGFRILTNEGKERYYYPLIQKVYTKDQFYKANGGFSTIPPNSPVKTAFVFSRIDSDYPDEKIQLVKYQYKYSTGYPKDSPNFKWRKDYHNNGRKSFINEYGMNDARIVSYTDFTPDRLYFDSKVLAYNEQEVVISFRSSPAEDAPISIQSLDVKTAKILWTTPIDEKIYIYDDNSLITNSGYFIGGNIYDLFLDKNGKIVNKFKPRDL